MTRTDKNRTTVIVPVYSGTDQVRACIGSLMASREVEPFQLLVIYDCGPDEELADYVRRLKVNDYINVIENPQNLGFVKSVNIGFRASGRDDVVVLNSDTIVPLRWLAKLHDAAKHDLAIGTITPLSNNAEIVSFPKLCKMNRLPSAYSVDLVDEILGAHVPPVLVDLPTGVGFCMYIPRAVIDKVGVFDEDAFGRGYGEENDFCQRAAAYGFRNVALANLWVYHEGGVSFGKDKARLVAKHSEIILKRYPGYFPAVNDFIRQDPLGEMRLHGVVSLIAKGPVPCVVMIGHGLGGGTGRHMKELAEYLDEAINAVTVEPYDRRKIAVTLPGWAWPHPIFFDRAKDYAALISFVSALGPGLIHVHHIKGMEGLIASALKQLSIPHVVTLHDFYLIAANPTLTNTEGRYEPERVIDPSLLAQDLKKATGMEWAEWRSLTEELLYKAKVVIAPSEAVVEVYRQQYPRLTCKVTDHPDAERAGLYPSVVSPRVEGTPKVLVLGALSREKGADVLERTAALAKRNQLPLEFHLLGYAYRPLSKAVVAHGAYRDDELKALIQGIDPQFIWFPCLWPETYSYTMSTVLEAGLPVLAPKLGALSSRITGRPLSETVDGWPSAEQWLKELARFSEALKNCEGQQFLWADQLAATQYYKEEYIKLIDAPLPKLTPVSISQVTRQVLSIQPAIGRSLGERIVFWLVRVRDLPLVRPVSAFVPLRYQRIVKRIFVRRPVHEIIAAAKDES